MKKRRQNEMKSYLSLVPILAKQRKRQNRLTLICIILAVFLVTSVFSMADIWLRGENEAMVRRHGNYHIILSGISKEQAARIAAQDDVSGAAWYGSFGEKIYEGCGVSGKRAVFYGVEPSYIYDIRGYATKGSLPQDKDEVMLSAQALEKLGIHIGDSVVINTPAKDFFCTVCGFCEDDTVYNDSIGGVCAYMNLDALQSLCEANGETAALSYYVRFAEGTKLRGAIADMKERYGLGEGSVEENMVTVGMSGASTKERFINIYGLAAVLFFLVLLAGVLMISSCMNSNIARRTKFFGMLRCIGASRQQVMRFVRLEALGWCGTAIPVGCVLSFVCTFLVCGILRNLVRGEFEEISFRFSPIGIVSGVLVGLITVLLAAHSPAKRAAGVSPVAAVTGGQETGQKVMRAAPLCLFKVESALGIRHAVSAKRNFVLMTLSFALTVTLLFTFSACLAVVNRLLPAVGSFSPDVEMTGRGNTNSIDRGIKEEIAALPGVEAVWGNAIAFDVSVEINGTSGVVDLVSYDDYMLRDARKSVVSGDLSKVTDGAGYVLTIFNEGSRLHTGDRIRLGDAQLEVACVVSEGIGGWGNPLLVCTEETFTRLTGEDRYMLVNAVLKKDAPEETVQAMEELAGENDFHDRRQEKTETYGSYWVFRVAACGFLAIIALITVFHIMNSVSMSVTARMKQYGAMRAVGMSMGQVKRMIAAEALTYAVCGLVVGLAGGLFFHRLIIVNVLISHFGGTWKLPTESIGAAFLLFVLSCGAAVYVPVKRLGAMAVTETINEL